MPLWTGFFDSAGAPSLTIEIGNPFLNSSQEYDVIIDTGFSGFISMPIVQAFPLGLILLGTTTVVLADGTASYKLTAMGTATVAEEAKSGVIILEQGSSEILIGIDFLRTFERVLFIHATNQVVLLQEESVVNAHVAATLNNTAESQTSDSNIDSEQGEAASDIGKDSSTGSGAAP